MRKIRHIILIIFNRVPYQFSTELMEFQMALENFTAKAAELSASADRLLAKAASDEQALAQAQSDLASVDQAATAAIQPVIDKIDAVVPPPVA